MKFCKNCSSRIDDTVTICPICGANALTGAAPIKNELPKFKPVGGGDASPSPGGSVPKFSDTPKPRTPPASSGEAYGGYSSEKAVPINPAPPSFGYPGKKTMPQNPAPAHLPYSHETGASKDSGMAHIEYPYTAERREPIYDKYPKSTPESESFVRSTGRVTNIILSIMIVIALVIAGCLVYVRFLASPDESHWAADVKILVEECEGAINNGDAEALNSLTVLSVLSDSQLKKMYGSSREEIGNNLYGIFQNSGDYKLTIKNVIVTDMEISEINEKSEVMPQEIQIENGVNISCTMTLEKDDSKHSKERNISAVQIDGKWYMFEL